MKLNIKNEYSTLKKVIVSYGHAMHEYGGETFDEEEFTKYHNQKWDKQLLIDQQSKFFELLTKYDVELLFAKIDPKLVHQMYTRDTGFVCGDKLFCAKDRGFSVRKGECEAISDHFKRVAPNDIIKITNGQIEGGDVLIDEDIIFIGKGSRTTSDAIVVVKNYCPVRVLSLGNKVMHLDTKMTLLPQKYALIDLSVFQSEDIKYLKSRYKFIEVTKEESASLATNVFMINPETVVVNKSHTRIQSELKEKGFKIEVLDYSEPIALAGSFRCTTLPLIRED